MKSLNIAEFSQNECKERWHAKEENIAIRLDNLPQNLDAPADAFETRLQKGLCTFEELVSFFDIIDFEPTGNHFFLPVFPATTRDRPR